MKRLVITLTLAFSLCSFSSFANDETISPAAIESFNNSFKSVKDVSWSIGENFYKATFLMNGQSVCAFYNSQGQMIALTRNISSLQLPIALQAKLKKEYNDYWISDLFEMATEEGTFYYLTVEDGDSKIVLKSGTGSEWSVYKKQRKS